jgi:ABC-type branched-subunit amino acid transport system substrate-binding protein
MNRRDILRRASALALAAASLPARSESTRQSPSPQKIVLGQSAAFSGPAAQLGIQMNKGARLYFDALNAGGGINGAAIELRTADDGYEPERCKANTQAFLDAEVFALFGYVGTPTCLAALPLVKDSGIPFFGPFTGAEALREPMHRNVFHLRASYYDETALIVRQLTTLGLNKIAVFYQNDAYGKAGLEGVNRALKPLGLAPVALGTVERNTVAVAQAVKDIVPKLPDAVVQISAYKSCAAFIREARKAGYGGTFINVSFVGTKALADELGAEGKGVMITQVVPYPYTNALAISREYLEAVHKAGPEATANYSSLEGYLAAKVFAEGLRRAGPRPTHETLIAALESIRSESFGGFNVGFGPRDHVGSHFVELSMLTGDGSVRH